MLINGFLTVYLCKTTTTYFPEFYYEGHSAEHEITYYSVGLIVSAKLMKQLCFLRIFTRHFSFGYITLALLTKFKTKSRYFVNTSFMDEPNNTPLSNNCNWIDNPVIFLSLKIISTVNSKRHKKNIISALVTFLGFINKEVSA